MNHNTCTCSGCMEARALTAERELAEAQAEAARLRGQLQSYEATIRKLTGAIAAGDADAEAARLREVQRWIPVDERLPDDKRNYLVELCFPSDALTRPALWYVVRVAYYSRDAGRWFLVDDMGREIQVVSWRPIPPRPAEQED